MVIKSKHDTNLTVLLEPVDSAISISAGLWVKTGSRHERDDQYGYAHFVEHMLFKGTEKYSTKDIARLVDRVGGQHNAATNREYTCYYINVVADFLELALDILSDMYYNSTLDSEELDKEKNVILEEIRMYEDTPDEFIHDRFMENMFHGHPLSHSILGTIDSIESASRDSLMSFYKEHYINSNTVLVISGKFDPEQTKKLIDRYFDRNDGSVRSGAKPLSVLPQPINLQHVDRDLEQIHFCLGTDGIKRNDPDRWPLYVLSTILGGSMSSRLFQNIREKLGISYSIYSFHSSYCDNGVFGIYCATIPENYQRTIDLIIQECRDLLINSITKEELEDAKTFMTGNLALSLESIEVRMGQLAKYEIVYGRNFSLEEIFSEINNISLDDFNKISTRIFSNKTVSLVSVGNLKDFKIDDMNLKI